jgi:hypothetical protein
MKALEGRLRQEGCHWAVRFCKKSKRAETQQQSEGEPTHLRSANMEPVIAGGAMNPSGINANESVVRPSRMSTRLTQLQGYGLAVLFVGVAVGASLLLEHFGFRPPTAQLMLFAVAIISWYRERGPSLFSLKWGSCLSTVYSSCSGYRSAIPAHGHRLPGNVAGVSRSVPERHSLYRIPGAAAVG